METPQHSLAPEPQEVARTIPVLIVDDRPENLTALQALLEGLPQPLELVRANSGNEALRQTLRHDFAVVLLDVQMPDMDGLETAELLRANPKTRHLPIIFVTAGLHDKVRQFKGYEMGAVDFLNKPIEPMVLRSKVGVLCDLFAKCRELEEHKACLEQKVQERTANLSALAVQLSEEVQARRLSEQALHDSEMRLRMVIDSASEAFIGLSASAAITDWNHQAESLFGWRREEALGQPASLVLSAQPGQADALQPLLAGGTGLALSRQVELRGRRRDGHEFDVELSLWQIPHAAPPLYGALVRDITQRKEAEEARSCELRQAMQQIVESEKLAALGSIVAGVAHELNTPVGNLVLLASALNDRVSELAGDALAGKLTRSGLVQAASDIREASTVLIRSAGKARELIESFKNVAVDQTSQRRRQFDLRSCLNDILVTLGRMTRQANVTVELQVPGGILMDSYPGHLEQIFNNLIVNSILHGFDGREGGRVLIDASQQGDQVCLVYADDGVGIPPEVQDKVFEPFFSTKFGAGGSGLGMFIVHNLVCGPLQGSVELSSTPGAGVRFAFRLPSAAA